MIEITRYKPEHLIEILRHPSQALTAKYVKESDAEALDRHEFAYTALKDGKPVACLGLIKYWEGRYEAWAFMLSGQRDSFISIHNATRKFLKESPIRRIEATVDMGFINGHKWAMMLGFKCECECLRAYGPTGNDHRLYVHFKEDV